MKENILWSYVAFHALSVELPEQPESVLGSFQSKLLICGPHESTSNSNASCKM